MSGLSLLGTRSSLEAFVAPGGGYLVLKNRGYAKIPCVDGVDLATAGSPLWSSASLSSAAALAAALIVQRRHVHAHLGRRCRAIPRAAASGDMGRPDDPSPPWQLAWDDSSSNWYYYNEDTQETSWEPPTAELSSSGWQPVETKDGELYYYNEETQETSWTLPDTVSHVGKEASSTMASQQAPDVAESSVPAEADKSTGTSSKRKKVKKTTEQQATETPILEGSSAEITRAADLLVEELFLPPGDALDIAERYKELREVSPEGLRSTLTFLQEELQPGLAPWAAAARNDPRLFTARVDDLHEALVWLEEFLWNQDWGVGFGRQALATAIQHQPSLLYQGVEKLEETADWLAQHGVDDESVRSYVAGPTAVPFPVEPYPWIELLQLGSERLEAAASWAAVELNWSPLEVSKALRCEPHMLLLAATAAGAGPPRPGFPLPVPRHSWMETHVRQAELAGT